MTIKDFDIEEIRKAISKLAIAVKNQSRRGVMAYDWDVYGQPELSYLCNVSKVKITGEIRKKDKRESWR